MYKKIQKYKMKKNKLEEKIFNLLNLKKEYYENEIINSNNNKFISSNIEVFLNNYKLLTNSKKSIDSIELIIIVFGIYSVGKTTFINHLENYINIQIEFILKNNINLIHKILFENNNKLNIISNKIIIIECNNNDIENINLLLQNKNIIYINIIPKNKLYLKNKYINKIISDIKNKTSYFLNNVNFIDNNVKYIINEKIDLLKLKKNIFIDSDFIFLDQLIDLHFDLYYNIDNINKILNIHKYFI
jgi:hypothetical protein